MAGRGSVIDGHATIGANRDVSLSAEALLAKMDLVGIDVALIAPPEASVAVRNRDGNRMVADVARACDGRFVPYCVATPWLGDEALDVLEEAAELGARALKFDPAVQGFDLLDGQIDPLLDFAERHAWPVYVRTGTPPFALPLTLAGLSRRFPDVAFILGRNGCTDFWLDVPPAMATAANLYADTAATFWDLGLVQLVEDAVVGADRIIFSTDAPFGEVEEEVANVLALPVGGGDRRAILGGTLGSLLHYGAAR